jgi:hypothetical protein
VLERLHRRWHEPSVCLRQKPGIGNMEGDATSHHLLKHSIPSVQRVLECFEGVPAKDIGKSIAKMGQRELQVCCAPARAACRGPYS